MADPMTEGSRSIMEYLREKAVREVKFGFSIDLNTAGVGGKPRILVYSNTSEVHKVHLPGGGIEFGEVKNDGHYKWSRPGIYGFGGYENCIPLAKRAIDSN
jgi:hypothetical protein